MATSMSFILFFLVILMYVLPPESSAISDPCVSHEIIHKGKYRGTKCNYRLGKAVSDRYINDSLWYKAVGSNGPLSMPTFSVNVDECSTKMPIWMNGTHPDTGVIVNRTACMTGPTMKCKAEYKIQVKNCSAFNVYKLQITTGLEMAYCFGENEPCPPIDPCVDIDREELVDDGHRTPTCSRTDLCDNNINGWYRVNKHGSDGTGLKMSDKCPRPGSCGATSPIWLEERHPSPSDGIVTRNACVRNETDCCGERIQIRVVNCQSYYVYELKARTTCPERYCFGNVDNGENVPCPPIDPCVDIDREELVDDGHRTPTCSRTDLCDNNINGWYRVNKHGSDGTGLKMSDKCPRPGYCGATSPIWLEERHPSPSDGIVTRNACVRNETDCCGERIQIRVVNCQSYYAYELKARTTCPERYCFGNVDNDIDCIANNGTFGHNSGCHLQTNTVLEVISAFLLLWMFSR